MDTGQNSTVCAPLLPDNPADSRARTFPPGTLVAPLSPINPPRGAAPAAPQSPRRPDAMTLGRFALLKRLGAGSFGEVWKAYDALLERFVAVKVAHLPVTNLLAAPMLSEARLAARLRHPNIVRIHEIDVCNKRVYIVSDLIDGTTLDDWRQTAPPAIPAIVAMTEKLARALDHAHEHGIIHRDLKPGNVMIGRDGEPYLVDFGLALSPSRNGAAGAGSQIVGTPHYMSPEQARGDSQTVDRRADLYSLGVILFELLTGRTPFNGTTRELIHSLQTASPPGLRGFNPAVSRDLEQVCLKCLQRAPQDRYATALELADDLARAAAGHPVRARRISPIARHTRALRRHKTLCITLLLLVGATVLSGAALRHKQLTQTRLEIHEAHSAVLGNAVWTLRITHRAQSSRYRDAVAEAERLRNRPFLAPNQCYDLACVYALACRSARQDAELDEPSRRKLLDDWRSTALALLQQARSRGYFESPDCRVHVRRDPQLEHLRDLPEFANFIGSL